jgi:hypothetical protein
MEGIDGELEDEILWRVVNRADRNLSMETNGSLETHYEPELAAAMQLTGGYVGWLRENAAEKLGEIETPHEAKWKCTRLGKFVAFMRARPSTHQEESAEREFAARLVSQLMRLAKCLALVLNRDTVDEEVMRRVMRVALDTSRGQTLAIVAYLFDRGEGGMTSDNLVLSLGKAHGKVGSMLRFLMGIGVVERFQQKTVEGKETRAQRWRLTESLQHLYAEVRGLEEEKIETVEEKIETEDPPTSSECEEEDEGWYYD